MKRYLTDALAGALATGAMSVVIGAAKTWGLLETPPPAEITSRAAGRVDGFDRVATRDQPAFGASWAVAHGGFGTACGVVYGRVALFLPASPIVSGLVFGGAVWGVNYLGILPALGLYPAPGRDTRERMCTMIAAHAVYGVSLALLRNRGHLSPEHRPARRR